MLQLKNITKVYEGNDNTVKALKGITICFRNSEFVSILGPSGCGKTTLLNIIGGLDQYTSGDLIIDHSSTKEFTDRDWDKFRNHQVGFVFQGYNLIAHQSVLANVELAMTLGGVSKADRKRRALQALEKVGLKEQINKLPNQLSGGQMQRVAIARALVNNPSIILADEPTGALDKDNSIQVMNILKEISKECLVIMVTHNPELAMEYSTRIVSLDDGLITDDTNEFFDDSPLQEPESRKIKKLPLKQRIFHFKIAKKNKMSYKAAFGLSLRNLLTKKTRTFLTSFAGSIGIIGIALILSVSSGFQNYINKIQQDTLTIYPLSVSQDSTNYSDILELLSSNIGKDENKDGKDIYATDTISKLVNSVAQTNEQTNIVEFKKQLEQEMKTNKKLADSISAITYDYGTYINIYDDKNTSINPANFIESLIKEVFSISSNGQATGASTINSLSKGISTLEGGIFSELLNNQKLIESQFELVAGEWPWDNKLFTDYSEAQKVIMIVDNNYGAPDYRLYELKMINDVSVHDVAMSIIDPENYQIATTKVNINDVIGKKYKALYKSDYFVQNDDETYRYATTDELNNVLDDQNRGLDLVLCGVVKENANQAAVSIKAGTLAYSHVLKDKYIEECSKSSIVQKQLENKEVNIFTGKTYASEIREYSRDDLESYFNSSFNESIGSNDFEYGNSMINGIEEKIVENREYYLSKINDQTVINLLKKKYNVASLDELTDEQVKVEVLWIMCNTDKYFVSFKNVLDEYFNSSSYENTKKIIGIYDEDSLKNINIYCSTFNNKDVVIDYINQYNSNNSSSQAITYSDYAGIMMKSVSRIINAISYILVGFISVSLIVSSIMIGIITYISVLERTREIGILRSIGASKGDIALVFNAETISIGMFSGIIGICFTLIVDVIINVVTNNFVSVGNIAKLPWWGAVGLIFISMLLTFISGLIPSQIASKKDPVIALKSE